MGGAPWGSPGVPRDGEKMNFPTIATPQARELARDATRSSQGCRSQKGWAVGMFWEGKTPSQA